MTDEERESKQGSIDIRKLPGYEVNIRLTSFIDAILVCNANAVSFRKWHDKINTPALVVMLKEPANYSLRHETNLELQRQFSNFLMSAFAVRDHWYALRNEYYIGTAVNEKINAFTSETFGKNELASFMHDFRNYITHKGYPLVSQTSSTKFPHPTRDLFHNKPLLFVFSARAAFPVRSENGLLSTTASHHNL